MQFHFRCICPLLLLVAGFIFLPHTAEAQKKGRKKNKHAVTAAQLLNNRLVQHVSVLAHDSLQGRRTGTEGEQKAIRYITGQYNQLGIPGAANGSYLQVFEIDEGKQFKNTSTLKLDDKPLMPGKDFFPFAWSSEGKVSSDAVVALNESGEAWWIDIDPIIEKNRDNPHFMLATHLQQVAKEAIEKGATSIIFYNDGDNPDSLAFISKDRTTPLSVPVFYIAKSTLASLHITENSAPFVEAEIKFEYLKRNGTNVIAGINNGVNYWVVIGGHFDHLGYGEDENSRHTGEPDIHNGADDNASGTAAVIELARLIKEKGDKRFNYLFLHFSGEELGLYGSKYFTEHPVIDLSKVTYMINLDMVGRLSDSTKALTVGGYGTSPAWGQIAAGSPDFTFKIDSSGTGPSDHTSFYRKDIPVLFFFTGLHTDYHKPGDDAQKINYAGLAGIVKYIEGVVDRTPVEDKLVFTKTREQSMGTGRFKVSIGIMPDYTFSGTGVKADGVIDGRPAQKAGLQANDVILQLGELLITSVETYMQALNRFDKGQTTNIVIKRGNEVLELPITF